jgi:excisionase family DNA binding protein
MRHESGTEPRLRRASGPTEAGDGGSRQLRGSSHYAYQVQNEGAERKLSQRLLTIKEAGAYLALGPWRVRSLIYRGELPYVRLGRRILLDLKDLDFFVEAKKVQECMRHNRREA